ncbi:MAG: hypothetical protein HQK97_07975 [Nitrospirae bacterium]|nr:hypothetical protein [Nitrospirota bacterium]
MAAVLFDTLKAFESLKSSGPTEEQAKGSSEALKTSQESSVEGLAAKADIETLDYFIFSLCAPIILSNLNIL